MIFEVWRSPGSASVFPADSPEHRRLLTMTDDKGPLEEWAELVAILEMSPDEVREWFDQAQDDGTFDEMKAIYRLLWR